MTIFEIMLNLLVIAWALTFVGKSVIDLYFYFLIRKVSWRREAEEEND